MSLSVQRSVVESFTDVGQCLVNVDPKLKMKQNPTSDLQHCTMLIQRQCPMLKQGGNNIAQRWYNDDTTLFQPSVNIS